MRYLATALAALLISVPAVAVAGGPDALSIAKRALALAKEPPAVTHVYGEMLVGPVGYAPGRYEVHATCPRGMVAIGAIPEDPANAVALSVRRRVGRVVYQLDYPYHGPGVTVTCIQGRLKR